MPSVLKLLNLAAGGGHPFANKYVVKYDPSPRNLPLGECILEVTNDIKLAKKYANHAEAYREYGRVDSRDPVRPDGHPNRPLTAFHVQIETV